MNILVYPHQMIIGGSQINALELAAKVRDRGHDVTIIAPDGPLVDMARNLNLTYHCTASDSEDVSPRNALQMSHLVRELEIEVLHAYEWRPAMEMSFGPHLLRQTPLVVTVLSMYVSGFIPRHLPLIVGTRELAEDMERKKRPAVHVIEPPIDAGLNRRSDAVAARRQWSFSDEEIVLSIVCRMSHDLQKLEGVLQAMTVIGHIAQTQAVRFLVVGGGEGLEDVLGRAQAINSRLNREVILVTGPMADPRLAYEASDIVLGMGSSILRGMAFGNAVVVQGANGFWRLLDERSVKTFLWQGWYGDGGAGAPELDDILRRLIADRPRMATLGQYGRSLVEDHFDLERAADRLLAIYTAATSGKTNTGSWPSLLGSAASFAKCEAHIAHSRLASILTPQRRRS